MCRLAKGNRVFVFSSYAEDFTGVTYDEGASVLMLLDSVCVELAQVAEIAEGDAGVAYGNVNGEELAQGEGIAQMGTTDVVVVVSTVEEVVVTLSVLGHKGSSQQRKMGLVVEGDGMLFYLEAVIGTDESRGGDAGMRLSRVVAVPVIVQDSQCSANHATGGEIEILP